MAAVPAQTNAADSDEKVAELQAQFPDTPLERARLKRFLRARDGNIKAAADLLKLDIEWRASRPVPPPPPSFADRLAQRKAYFHLKSKSGMPLIVVIPGRHKNTEPVEENIAYAIYLFELAISSMAPDVERIMIIIDFEGFGMSCLDYPFLRQAISILQNDYPERLGCVCLLDPPFIFRAAWAVIRPWLDEKTRNKVQFLSGDYKSALLAQVDAASLPAKYGGSSTYNYDPTDPQHLYGLVSVFSAPSAPVVPAAAAAANAPDPNAATTPTAAETTTAVTSSPHPPPDCTTQAISHSTPPDAVVVAPPSANP